MSGASPPELLGRQSACETLGRLVEDVRAGQSGVLVLRGEAGIGKSALLNYLCDRVSGLQLARAAGVESEMELAFAGLHQLCAPFLDRLPRLPGPQADALRSAFGLRSGDAPDRFLVGLAVLTLLSEVADEQPLICVVDDAQWLDRASVQALAFAARRLAAESVVMVFAVREHSDDRELATLPEGRTPTRADWQRISERIRGVLEEKIAMLQRTRDKLDGCIGCGCLSLKSCALTNPADDLADLGPGAVLLDPDRRPW